MSLEDRFRQRFRRARRAPGGRPTLGLALGLALLGSTGCGILDPGDPSVARLSVTGESSTGTFRLVTSNDFDVVAQGEGEQDGRVAVLEVADTSVVELPFDDRFDLGPRLRFYVQVSAVEEGEEANLSVRVLIDDAERFNQSRPVDTEPMTFYYLFN